MNEQQFKDRTKKLGLRIIRLVRALPRDAVAAVIGNQLVRAGTSVGSNYRSACRARSNADIIAKLKIVEEEADETAYWLEMLIDSDLVPQRRLSPLLNETGQS